jgi:hypothetical protein
MTAEILLSVVVFIAMFGCLWLMIAVVNLPVVEDFAPINGENPDIIQLSRFREEQRDDDKGNNRAYSIHA